MMPPIPQSVVACVIRESTAPGMRREMAEIAREGLRVVLDAEQVGIVLGMFASLEDDVKRLSGDLYAYKPHRE